MSLRQASTRLIASDLEIIDYILASQNLFEFIQSFDVDGPNILTDHCCISLNLQFPLYDATHADEISYASEKVNGKYLWNSDLIYFEI